MRPDKRHPLSPQHLPAGRQAQHSTTSTSLKPGAHVHLRVDRLSLGGDGVGRIGPCVVFVPYSCPGDTLDVQITELHRNFARAKLLRVVTASQDRIIPPCPYHFRTEDSGLRTEKKTQLSPSLYCGGCS